MNIVEYGSILEDTAFAEQWNALVQRMESPQVFYTWEWARAVAVAYPERKPCLLAGYCGGLLKGVVALATERDHDRTVFLTATTADYCDFISPPDDRAEFVQAVIAHLRKSRRSTLELASIPADSHTVGALHSARGEQGFFSFTRPAYICAQVRLDDDEKRRQVRKSVHAKLRRMINGAAGQGQISVDHLDGWEQFQEQFPDFASAHVGRFLSSGRKSNLISEQRRKFLVELATLLSTRKWFHVSTLKLDGRAIAWNYGFRFAGSWFWYQPAFDAELNHLSPGSYLLCEILRSSCQGNDVHTVDLGLGDEEYKQRYARSGRQTLHFTIKASAAGIASAALRYRASTLVRKSRVLENAIRYWRTRAKAVENNIKARGPWRASRNYFARAVATRSGVRFFEFNRQTNFTGQFSLQPLSLKLLAEAAMEYEIDLETYDYIQRSALRLKTPEQHSRGFVLRDQNDAALHFCWVAQFEGFYMSELGVELSDPALDSVLIFDCWTPVSRRGRGHYAECISAVANQLLEQGKQPWIFSSASNPNSLKGIERAGFCYRYSLQRRGKLFKARVVRLDAVCEGQPRFNLHPAA